MMKPLIKEITQSKLNAIDSAVVISAGNGDWVAQARMLGSNRIVSTEPHPYLAHRLDQLAKKRPGEEVLQLAVVDGRSATATLSIYNNMKFNTLATVAISDETQPNLKKIDEQVVPSRSLRAIINEIDIDPHHINLLIINAPHQSSSLIESTPNYYLEKFTWIIISEILEQGDNSLDTLRTQLKSAGFEETSSYNTIYPFCETLYRRTRPDNLYGRGALERMLGTPVQTCGFSPSPQQAFDVFHKSQTTKMGSDLASACLSCIAVKNFRAAAYLIKQIECNTTFQINLPKLLWEKLERSIQDHNSALAPEISVIIPYHNRGSIIAECINSVLNQTTRNIEVIVVDDGSTDDSRSIVHGIQDERLIRIDCSTASGNSGTPRNFALKRAKGTFIAFVDSDDTIDERYLEELLTEAKRTDAEVTLSKTFNKIFKDTGGNIKANRINYLYKPGFIADSEKQYFFVNSFVIWDKLYKRSFLASHNIKLAESKIGADTLMVAKVYYYATKISICNNSAAYNYNAFSEGSVTQIYRSRGDIREEDRPYAETFNWMIEEDISKSYVLIQWIRRLMSLSYCLSSSTGDLSQQALEYLQLTLKEAPFKSALTHLKRKGLNEQYQSIQRLLGMLGRKVIDV
jgi:glycosyltransferase involved in cell wall biosynthesis